MKIIDTHTHWNMAMGVREVTYYGGLQALLEEKNKKLEKYLGNIYKMVVIFYLERIDYLFGLEEKLKKKIVPAIDLTEESFYKKNLEKATKIIKENDIYILKFHTEYEAGDYVWNGYKFITNLLRRSDFILQFHTDRALEDVRGRMKVFEKIIKKGGKIHLVHGLGQTYDAFGSRRDFAEKCFSILKKWAEKELLVFGSTNLYGTQVLLDEKVGTWRESVDMFREKIGDVNKYVVFESDLGAIYSIPLEDIKIISERFGNNILYKTPKEFYNL